MNPLDYCSLEMSRKLADAGIVLETNMNWANVKGYDDVEEWELNYSWGEYPAPSMSELWRELPEDIVDEGMAYRRMLSVEGLPLKTVAGYYHCTQVIPWLVKYSSVNPCDALAELLILVRKEAGDE